MSLNILMVLDLYPPLLGGAQIQTQLLSLELARRGHSVSVATLWQDGLPESEVDQGVNIYRIKGLLMKVRWLWRDPGRRDSPPYPEPGLVFRLRKLIERLQPDVVMVYGWVAYSCTAALAGKKIPLVISSRDYGYSCAIRVLINQEKVCSGPELMKCLACVNQHWGRIKGPILLAGVFSGRALLLRKASAFQNVSNFVKNVVERDLLASGKKRKNGTFYKNEVIHDLFSDAGLTEPDPTILRKLPEQPFILYVGALARYKGLDVLLAAYQRLKGPPPLVLCGIVLPDTPESFPPGVIALRQVPHPTVMAIWKRCLFGVTPSLCPDSFPNVVLEAMRMGKPVIGACTGGIPDMIVNGETGFLFPPGDDEELARLMRLLIDNEGLRIRTGVSGQERLKHHFSAEIIVPQFEKLFTELSKGNSTDTGY